MRKSKFSFLIWLSTGIIVACSDPKPKNAENTTTIKPNTTNADTSFFADKNFVFKNLTNTLDVKLISPTPAGNGDTSLYTDSSYKRTFTPLTPNQKSLLIASFITKELGVNEKYPRDLMNAYFISKQAKIGDKLPIIIQISGDDYGSLTMIILDKDNKPISGYNLSGGMEGGPTQIGDSLISYEARSYSHINNNEITTYRITETDHTDTAKKQVIIDSNVFKTLVTQNGNFLTKQIVKIRFTKAYKN